MSRSSPLTIFAVTFAVIVALCSPALAANLMDGFEVVTPVATTGTGDIQVQVAADGASIHFRLTYQNLEGDATAAHIHLGQPGVNGPVLFTLCGGSSGIVCPARSGVVEGDLTGADISAEVAGNGVLAGEIDRAIALIRAGVTYADVHTTRFPGGLACPCRSADSEIRGQILVIGQALIQFGGGGGTPGLPGITPLNPGPGPGPGPGPEPGGDCDEFRNFGQCRSADVSSGNHAGGNGNNEPGDPNANQPGQGQGRGPQGGPLKIQYGLD